MLLMLPCRDAATQNDPILAAELRYGSLLAELARLLLSDELKDEKVGNDDTFAPVALCYHFGHCW